MPRDLSVTANSDATPSASAQGDKAAATGSSTSSSSDSDEDITVSALHSADPSAKDTDSMLELTEFAKMNEKGFLC